jgi:hypothetical protein
MTMTPTRIFLSINGLSLKLDLGRPSNNARRKPGQASICLKLKVVANTSFHSKSLIQCVLSNFPPVYPAPGMLPNSGSLTMEDDSVGRPGLIGGHNTNVGLTSQVLFLATALSFVARAGWSPVISTKARSVVFSQWGLF